MRLFVFVSAFFEKSEKTFLAFIDNKLVRERYGRKNLEGIFEITDAISAVTVASETYINPFPFA